MCNDRRASRYDRSSALRSARYVVFTLRLGRYNCRQLGVTSALGLSSLTRASLPLSDIIIDKQDPKYGPTYLTVNVKPANRVFDTDLHNAPIRQRLKPLSHLMEAKKGEVTHQFEVDGTATICLRSSIASAKNVMAFAMRVETSEEVPGIRAEKKRKDAAAVAAATTDVDQHLTHMELELKRISLAMNHVLKEADLNKDQDARFHDQTLAMHRATTFWPIVQVCVLLMTGFTQASHIVRFFKSRRII